MALTTEPGLRQSNSAYLNLAHEDLMDMLQRVEPANTPLYTMCPNEYELNNTEFSWEVDSWPSNLGAVGPGDAYAIQGTEVRDVAANRRKMGNYGQAFRRSFGAGWIANQVPKLPSAKKGNLLSQGMADAMVLLKQDIEAAFASFDQTATPDVGGASGSIMAGVKKLIDPANKYSAASAYTYGKPTDLHFAPTGACVTGTLASAFNLSAIRTALQQLRQATLRKKDYVLLAGLDLRAQVTGLIDPTTTSLTGGALATTQGRMFTQSLDDHELGISVDVIRTDYGRLLVVDTDYIGKTLTDAAESPATRPGRVYFSKPKYGLILSREKMFKRWGVPFQDGELADDGGSKNQYVRGYCTLGIGNPVGFGFFELT